MSKNSKDLLSGPKVLTTSATRTIAKWIVICAVIGLVVGIGAMVFLNLGLHEKLMGAESMEVVAYNASNSEELSTEDKTIGLADLGITFNDRAVMYNGSEQSVVAENIDKLPKEVEVTYVNNVHTDVGTYQAAAVFSGKGYATEILYAELKIVKASIDGITFSDKLVEYKEGTVHSIEIEGELPNGATVTYALNEAEAVGIYHATAVISGDNYDTLVLEADLTIVNLSQLVFFPGLESIDEESEDQAIFFTYNKKDHKVELNTSGVLTEILENRNFAVSYKVTPQGGVATEGNTFQPAGTYTITATVSADGFTTFDVSETVIVKQGDMEKVHGLKVDSNKVEYDGSQKSVSVSFTDEQTEHITSVIKYYRVIDAENEVYEEIFDADVCNPGTYRVVLVFTDPTGNCEEKTIEREFIIEKRNIKYFFDMESASFTYSEMWNEETGEDEARVRRLKMIIDTTLLHETILAQNLVITYTYGETTVIATYIFTEENVTVMYHTQDGELISSDEYYHGRIEVEIPIGFSNVNKYNITAVVSGNDYDADAEIKSTLEIKYARLSGVKVNNNQLVFADGKLHLPKVTKGSGVSVDVLYNGQAVDGFKYAGIYNVEVVFTKGNYQTTQKVNYIVMFNPLIALIGMLLGMILGLGVGVIATLVYDKQEKSSHKHFEAPSAIVANARGGILCESYAKCDNSGCAGRLYLSSKALEFYADDYKSLKNNFLIDIDDIRNVDAIAHNKIKVYAKKEAYIFTVPAGKSQEWVHEIIHA